MELRPPSMSSTGNRLASLDALRGTVMIIMAIDHVRDFFDRYSMSNSPTDLSKTSAIMFLTRWITHLCMPVFMFSAGAGAFLWWNRGDKTRGQSLLVSRHARRLVPGARSRRHELRL